MEEIGSQRGEVRPIGSDDYQSDERNCRPSFAAYANL